MKVFSSPISSWIEGLRQANRTLNPLELYVMLSSAQKELRTNVIGKFPIALNAAVPSPDSRYIAVVGDSQMVFICPLDKVIEGRVMKYKSPSSDTDVFMPHVIRLKLPVG